MNTKNIGETAPACMSAFSEATPGIIGELLRQGLRYCLYFRLGGEASPTIGTLEYEYRLHGVWVFLAERFEFSELEVRLSKIEKIPVLIGQKAYAHMNGLGMGAMFARLQPAQLAELLAVFDRIPQRWTKTDEEEFRILQQSVDIPRLRGGR